MQKKGGLRLAFEVSRVAKGSEVRNEAASESQGRDSETVDVK